MSRRRMIHDSLWRSQTLAGLPMEVCLLFVGLITTADDQGRREGHAGLVRADVFPLRDIALDDIREWLDQLERAGSILRYVGDERAIIQIVNWWEYQSPTWAWPSSLPGPEGWSDRLRYREGNRVIEANWSESEPTVSPQRADPETAPNGNGNGNGNDSGSGNDNGVGAIAAELTAAGLTDTETVAKEALEAGLSFDDVLGILGYARANKKLRTGWIRTMCQRGQRAPPVPDPERARDYAGGEYAEYIVT